MVEEDSGAAGGHDLRQGVAALMDTMRDLLNNIQPAPPPREDENQEREDDDDVAEFD